MLTDCLYDGQICPVSLSCGEDLECAAMTLMDKFKLPQNSVLIHCLEPFDQEYKRIITRVPLNQVPQTLYLYSIPEAEYLSSFSKVIVNDSSLDYPQTELVIGNHQQLGQLDQMFKLTKGYDKNEQINYTRPQAPGLQQLSLNVSIAELGPQPRLVARRKNALVKVISQGVTLGKARINCQDFSVPASQLLSRKFKSLCDTNNLSDKRIFYKHKSTMHDQQMIISPEWDSQISIHILNKPTSGSNSCSLFTNQQSCREQNNHTHSPPLSSPQTINMGQSSSKMRYYNLQAMADFKNTKSQLRQALRIKDTRTQDDKIKDLIVKQLSLCLQY